MEFLFLHLWRIVVIIAIPAPVMYEYTHSLTGRAPHDEDRQDVHGDGARIGGRAEKY